MADRDALIAALTRLNGADSEAVERAADKLLFMDILAKANELPRATTHRKRGGADAEILELGTLARKLGEHILSMHQPALDRVRAHSNDREPLAFTDELQAWIEACNGALAAKQQSAEPSGAPPKARAASMARKLLVFYESLTGTRATIRSIEGNVYGPFVDFLSEAFEALEITASVESQARAAIVWRKGAPKPGT